MIIDTENKKKKNGRDALRRREVREGARREPHPASIIQLPVALNEHTHTHRQVWTNKYIVDVLKYIILCFTSFCIRQLI